MKKSQHERQGASGLATQRGRGSSPDPTPIARVKEPSDRSFTRPSLRSLRFVNRILKRSAARHTPRRRRRARRSRARSAISSSPPSPPSSVTELRRRYISSFTKREAICAPGLAAGAAPAASAEAGANSLPADATPGAAVGASARTGSDPGTWATSCSCALCFLRASATRFLFCSRARAARRPWLRCRAPARIAWPIMMADVTRQARSARRAA